MSALETQVGGDHYKTMAIQPAEYVHRNGIGFLEGAIIKYVSRWRRKGGVDDLAKAAHCIDLLRYFEEPREMATPRAIAVTVSCDDPAARIADLERQLDRAVRDLEDEQAAHDKTRALYRSTVQRLIEKEGQVERLQRDNQLIGELERERDEARKERDLASRLFNSGNFRAEAALTAEREAHEATRRELATLRDRCRPRRQSEEPAPRKELVHVYVPSDHGGAWVSTPGAFVQFDQFWAHQPPAPEGE